MYTRTLFIALVCFLLFMACGRTARIGRQVSRFNKNYRSLRFIAWNEDTVLSYKFMLRDNNRFLYVITQMNNVGKPEKKWYTGSVKYCGRDTLCLAYDKHEEPGFTTDYLVVEMSGCYLIQPCRFDKRRVFMRINNLRHQPL